MDRQAFRFFHRLRVRWVEVDMQKIVFNGHYLMYFDTAVADYWRALALPYEEAMHQLGGDLYVKKATLEYHASARYDDTLEVGLRCAATQTSRRVPDSLRGMLEGFERGEAMTRVQVGTWQELERDAAAVRTEVFVEEQGISREDEWDEADKTAVHAVVYNRMAMPLATGRLLVAAPGVGKIGRMASKRVLRGGHLGRQVLDALTQKAGERGDHEVLLHAQRSAAGFYAKSGFDERGEPFDEVGIAHIEMFKTL
jgi:YbgC/YbaW family acyl-CoA thioester hydrolase